jgi:hypothetical protein
METRLEKSFWIKEMGIASILEVVSSVIGLRPKLKALSPKILERKHSFGLRTDC